MPHFAEFQQKAKKLATCLARSYGQNMGCLSFFSLFIPNNAAMEDATTISMLAHSLDETYDLIQYVKLVKNEPQLTLDEFNEFRRKVIIGIYLLKWSQYSTSARTSLHQSLIDLFRKHLGVHSIGEINQDFFNSCLSDLSYYCTFVYERREEGSYSDLDHRLGATIQKEIHEAKYFSSRNNSLSFYGLYAGIMNSLGMSMY
ncbi:hypothetical protein OQJ18_05625 [Fluoribacter dumoffii]|uniref:Uncharacterized protein n=1 Tax=Fluoribacter dumoffii TaxID=463 RepID=A0A377G990_9GAMM|nr:hypothetical protein [Fluoribacter dumoffii]KTC90081.1 hypothetical protein Ldum_1149 [Fluoribacter dumoffii NY 23]MCW8385380.1 hypothetical protein [Fluoribacter dumoffii]MCW8418433.1 hypothetical protein [Fluoribacter dumoffii]MCW8453725.1 hypothetical protein [Fluoribacter dumoffii]MCW8462204.1 hypothetical protein [Fluoribacter dumoffii]